MALPKKLGFVLVALFFAIGGAPEEAEASNCTTEYLLCVNWAVQQGSPAEELGSIECAASYIGCVAGKLRFW